MPEITIRSARPSDAGALQRLAQLDSQRVPAGDLLVAVVGGELVAAVSSEGVIADPFRPTADVVDLLRMRAEATRASRRRPRRTALPHLRLAA